MSFTVQSNTRSSLRGAWVFAVLWNLVSAPILYFIPREIERNPPAAIGFLFPIVGVGLLAWAILTTLRWRRFGPSSFDMSTSAANPGSRVSGTIHTRLASAEIRSIRVTLKLTCLQRVISGSGKNRNTRENIVWREEYEVPEGQIAFGHAGASIPMQFALPPDALETTAVGRGAGVFWSLSAEAELPGVNLNEDFDIPVHRTGETAPESEPFFALPPASTRQRISPSDLAATGIRIQPTSEGTEYCFGPARAFSFGFFTLIFTLIWTGALWFQIYIGVPWIFVVITGLFDLLLVLIVLDLWFGTTTVVIGMGAVRRRHSMLGLGSTRVIPFSSITALDLHIGMQSTGRSGTPYYELRARLENGRKKHLGSGIRNKRHAEWLLGEMRRAIGLERPGLPSVRVDDRSLAEGRLR